MTDVVITDEMLKVISEVLKHGDTVELKREHNKLVVVEVRRKARIK